MSEKNMLSNLRYRLSIRKLVLHDTYEADTPQSFLAAKKQLATKVPSHRRPSKPGTEAPWDATRIHKATSAKPIHTPSPLITL